MYPDVVDGVKQNHRRGVKHTGDHSLKGHSLRGGVKGTCYCRKKARRRSRTPVTVEKNFMFEEWNTFH